MNKLQKAMVAYALIGAGSTLGLRNAIKRETEKVTTRIYEEHPEYVESKVWDNTLLIGSFIAVGALWPMSLLGRPKR